MIATLPSRRLTWRTRTCPATHRSGIRGATRGTTMTYRRAVHHLNAIALGLVVAGSTTSTASAQTQDSTARPTGLPKKIQWKFNFDAGVGGFGFGNSLYTDVRPDPSGNLGDDWVETFAKPALSAEYSLSTGALYGAAS